MVARLRFSKGRVTGRRFRGARSLQSAVLLARVESLVVGAAERVSVASVGGIESSGELLFVVAAAVSPAVLLLNVAFSSEVHQEHEHAGGKSDRCWP